MATNETADTAVEDAERRAERAKASLLSRVELLKHKLGDAREKLDISAHIAKHALPAVGIAFALGVAAGLGRNRSVASGEPGANPLRGAIWSALAAFGLRALRELAIGQLGSAARQWWTEPGSERPGELARPSVPLVER